MGRSNTGSSSNFLSSATVPVTGAPLSIAFWFKPAAAASYNLMKLYNSTTPTNNFIIGTGLNTAGRLGSDVNDGTHESFCETTVGIAAGQWYHAATIIASTSSNKVFLNGSSSASDATATTPTGINTLRIGTDEGGNSPLSGVIAEFGIWNVALAAGDVWKLSQGVLPWMVRPDGLVGYWLPRQDNGTVIAYGSNPFRPRTFDMTVNGAMPLDLHPPKMRYPANPKRKYWQLFQGVSGIAFDAASNSGSLAVVLGTTIIWNHTCTGSNRFLAVDVGVLSAGASVVSITYNGVALSLIKAKTTVTALGDVESWGLANPASGTNSIVVTLSGGGLLAAGEAVSYTNVHQTSPTEGSSGNQATNVGATDATVSCTSVADQCWIHAVCIASDTSITANQTTRNNLTDSSTASMGDEDFGPQSPGAKTMGYTGVGAGVTWAMVAYAIRPVGSSSLVVFNPYDIEHTPQHQAIMAM